MSEDTATNPTGTLEDPVKASDGTNGAQACAYPLQQEGTLPQQDTGNGVVPTGSQGVINVSYESPGTSEGTPMEVSVESTAWLPVAYPKPERLPTEEEIGLLFDPADEPGLAYRRPYGSAGRSPLDSPSKSSSWPVFVPCTSKSPPTSPPEASQEQQQEPPSGNYLLVGIYTYVPIHDPIGQVIQLEQVKKEQLNTKLQDFFPTFGCPLGAVRKAYLFRVQTSELALSWYEGANIAMSEVLNVNPKDYCDNGVKLYANLPKGDFRHPHGRFDTLVRIAKWIVVSARVAEMERLNGVNVYKWMESQYFVPHEEMPEFVDDSSDVLKFLRDETYRPYVCSLLRVKHRPSEVSKAYQHLLVTVNNPTHIPPPRVNRPKKTQAPPAEGLPSSSTNPPNICKP